MIRLTLTAAALTLSLAGAALAAPQSAATMLAVSRSDRPAQAPATPIRLPYALSHDIGEPGVATTSVERRSSGVTGSAGFLCGRQDIAVSEGSAGAYDSDPHGRFVGASLRLSFR